MLNRLSELTVEKLSQNEELVAATIISRQGSTPRTAGTKMLIFENGEFAGTIGGGLFEYQVIERARKVLAEGEPAFMSFDLTSEDFAAMDMICGGRLDVFLDLLKPDEKTVSVFKAWRAEIMAGRPGFLVTMVENPDPDSLRVHRAVIDAQGARTGSLPVEGAAIEEYLRQAGNAAHLWVKIHQNETLIIEPASDASSAYILGAGHVSMPTARLASMIGFRVTVMDDRPEFANEQRFPDASAIKVIKDYSRWTEDFSIDEKSFIVIVTRGHLHDKEALARALKTNAGYIGMIGSRKKRNTIYKALIEEGFTEEDIQRVHSPIGLAIDAETPEELAVSIIAEMIQVRAALKKL